MPEQIRWGLLSTANINTALIGPIQQSARSELVAVASRSDARARAYADEHGIPKAYGRYEALLADPDVDVVYIALPNALHAEWTVRAAEAGKHVLCEKPLVSTLAELDAVEQAARASGVTVFEAFMYLHHPQTQRVLEMVRAGDLGDVRLIHSWFSYFLPPERTSDVRLRPELAGGSLWDVGVYPNSLAIVMADAGAPVEVWAQQHLGETGVDVVFSGQLRFQSGAVAQIASGFRMPFREAAYIVGERATVYLPEPWKPGQVGRTSSELVIDTFDHQRETITIPAKNPYVSEVEAMEACVLDGAAPVVPLSQSRAFLQSILALYESARTGQPVSL